MRRCDVVEVVCWVVEVSADVLLESPPEPVDAWITSTTATTAITSATGASRRAGLRRPRSAIAILPQKGDAELRALQVPRGGAQLLGRHRGGLGGLPAAVGVRV